MKYSPFHPLFTHHPTPVHNQTGPSPAPPCGQSRMMQAFGCRGPAGSWSTWPAGRSGRAWGGLRRQRRCAAHCPRQQRPEGGCCCHRQDCRGGRRWPGTAATRSHLWAHRSSSKGPVGRAYKLTGWLVYWAEVRRRKGRCSWVVVQKELEIGSLITMLYRSFILYSLSFWWRSCGLNKKLFSYSQQVVKTAEQSSRSRSASVAYLSKMCVFWSQHDLHTHLPLLANLFSEI